MPFNLKARSIRCSTETHKTERRAHQHPGIVIKLDRLKQIAHFAINCSTHGISLFGPVKEHPGDSVFTVDPNCFAIFLR